MRLYLIRHPQPMVEPGTCYGATDLAVEPERLLQTASSVQQQLPAGIPVYSSPLQRCLGLAQALNPDARIDPRLAELDFGDWEMQPWSAIERSEIDAWSNDIAHYQPGGSESVSQMAQRIDNFYREMQQQTTPAVAVICHAGSIRLLTHCGLGLSPEQIAVRASQHAHNIACGEIVTLELSPCAVV